MNVYYIYEQLNDIKYRYWGEIKASHWSEARSIASMIHGISFGSVVACKSMLPSSVIID